MALSSEQLRRFWPLIIVAASGVAVGIAATHWTRFRRASEDRNGDHACVLPCYISLIDALQDHLERLQLEFNAEDWNSFVNALCRRLAAVKKELERTRDASTRLEGVVQVLNDDELVGFLRKEQRVVPILDSYIPRPGQTWDDYLRSRTEDERWPCSDDDASEPWVEFLLGSIDELTEALKQSRFVEGTRGEPVADSPTLSYKTVKVWFATDRAVTANAEYIGTRSRLIERQPVSLQYGWVEVCVPRIHERGTLEAPKKSSHEADPSKYIVVFSLDTKLRHNLQAFLSSVNGDLNKKEHELLLYIHGYNTSFLKAVKQAAQLKSDLNFQGTLILYSWASAGAFLEYSTDEANVEKAAEPLHKLLKKIMSEVHASRAHIVAHSMGNRALIGALEKLYKEGHRSPPRCPLSQIILVAADEDRSRFEKLVKQVSDIHSSPTVHRSDTNRSSDSIGTSRPHFSVYCSTEDKALKLSGTMHRCKYRLGDTRSYLDSQAAHLGGHDVIDATGTKQGTGTLFHSYHLRSSEVIADIQHLLEHRAVASERASRLHKIVKSGKNFYAFNKTSWSPAPRCFG